MPISTSNEAKREEPQEITCSGGIKLPPIAALLMKPQPQKDERNGE